MKKYIISGVVVLVIGVFIVYEVVMSHSSAASVANSASNSGANDASSTVTVVTPTPAPTPTPTPSPTPTPTPTPATGQYKDGTYSGPSATNSIYGPVQVQVTIAGGKMTAITMLQYPDAPGHTTDVSNESLPILKSEAIAAQSANVDIVSGATQTSQAFQASLGAVLKLAANS